MQIVPLCEYRPVVIYGIEFEGKVVYVGATTRGLKARIVAHFNHAQSDKGRLRSTCPKLYPFIRSNPDKERYRILVLDQCALSDSAAREQHFVALYDTKNQGLNANKGGNWASAEEHYLYGNKVARHIVDASVAARIGKKLSPDHIEAIRQGNARPGRKDARPVIRDDGVEFYGITAAARDLGVHRGSILYSMKKGTKCKGHTFRYKEPE